MPGESELFILPPFKETVRQFDDAVSRHVARATRSDGLLSSIQGHIIHEGKGSAHVRDDGDTAFTEMREINASFSLSNEDIEQIHPIKVLEVIRSIADQMARSQSQHLFELLDQTTQTTGNIVSGKGRPLSHDTLAEALDLVEHSFDSAGQPEVSLVVPPTLAKRMTELAAEAEADPAIKRRFDELMARKRDAYRTREMARNLAG